MRTHTHTHTRTNIHCRINMDPTGPKGPNQLGQLSDMYSLAKAFYPYLQQYPITAKLSLPSIALCSSLCSSSTRICSSPSQWGSTHISLYKTAPVHCLLPSLVSHFSFLLYIYFPKRGKRRVAGTGTDLEKKLLLKPFLINRPVQCEWGVLIRVLQFICLFIYSMLRLGTHLLWNKQKMHWI